AGRDRLGRRLLHFDEAHPAIAGDRQPVVVAEPRDLDAGRFRGLQDGRAVGDLHLDTVDGELGHVAPTPPPYAPARPRGPCRRPSVLPSAAGNAGSGPGSATPRRRPAHRSCGPPPAGSLAPAYRSR